jgi:hypothetical protein
MESVWEAGGRWWEKGGKGGKEKSEGEGRRGKREMV